MILETTEAPPLNDPSAADVDATIDEYSKVMAVATAAAVLVTGTAALTVIERSFRRRLKELE